MPPSGFFQFGTNAEQVAAEVAAAMTRIEAATRAAASGSRGMAAMQQNMLRATEASGGFQPDTGMKAFENSLVGVNRRMVELAGHMAAGGRPAQFVAEMQKLAKGGLAQAQQAQLSTLLQAPHSFLQNVNFQALGKAGGKVYGQNILDMAEQVVASNPKKFARQPNFIRDLRATVEAAQAQADPLALSKDASRLDRARLQSLKESLAATLSPQELKKQFPTVHGELATDPTLKALSERQKGAARPATDLVKQLQAEARDAERIAKSGASRKTSELEEAHRLNKKFDDEKIASAQRVANFENATLKQQQTIRAAARAENQRYDSQRLTDPTSRADFANASYAAQRRVLDAAHKEDAKRAVAQHEEALKENARLDGQYARAQGVRFGSQQQYSRVGADVFQLDREGNATRINSEMHEERARALAAETRAREQASAATQRATNVEQRQTVTGAFKRGFLGSGFNAGGGVGPTPTIREGLFNELGTLGTVARYSGVYAVLGGITGALADTKAEVLDFTDSLTDLKVALNYSPSVSNVLVDSLQQIAVISGSNTGAALDAAARGIRAFGSTAKTSGGDVASAGVDIATASTQISLITGKEMTDATGDVIAIASAFGLAASQANQVVDAVSAAKDFGGDPSNISQGLANFATTAGAAGFTLGEAANALSLVIARSDESGQTAATRLSRITAIFAGTTGRQVIADLNAAGLTNAKGQRVEIDPEASVRDQMRQIALAYQNAAPELQGKIRSALGGTANQRELLPLLEPGAFERIIRKGADQAGRGNEEVRRRANDLVGIFKKLRGDISAIQVNLFRSGAFDGLALALRGLEPALNLLGRIIGAIDHMNKYVKTLLGTLLDLQLVLLGLKAFGVIGSASMATLIRPVTKQPGAAAFGYGHPEVAMARATEVGGEVGAEQAKILAMQRDTVAMAEHTLAVARSTGANVAEAEASLLAAKADQVEAAKSAQNVLAPAGPRAFNLGLLKSVGYLAAFSAAVYVGSELFKMADKRREIEATDRKNVNAIGNADITTSAGATALVTSLAANAAELRKSQMGHSLSSLLVKGRRDDEIAETHAQERSFAALAQRLKSEEALANKLQSTAVFGDKATLTVNAVADGFARLATEGADGLVQFNKLMDAILKPPDESTGRRALPTDQRAKFAAGLVTDAMDSLDEALFKRDAEGNKIVARDRQGRKIKNARGEDTYERLDLYTRTPTTPSERAALEGQPGISADQVNFKTTHLTPKQVRALLVKKEADATKAALAQLDALGLAPGVAPTDAQYDLITNAAMKAFGLDKLGPDGKKARAAIAAAVTAKIKSDVAKAGADTASTPQDPAGAKELIEKSIIPSYTSGIASLPKSDIAGRQKAGKQMIAAIKAAQASAQLGSDGSEADTNALGSIARLLAVQQEVVSDALISDMEDLRKARQAQTKNKAKIRAIGAKAFRDEMKVALDAGNIAALTAIFNLASQAEINLALAALDEKAAAEAAANAARVRTAVAIAAASDAAGGTADEGTMMHRIAGAARGAAGSTKAQDDAKAAHEAARRAAPQASSDYTSPGGGGAGDQLTPAQIAAARRDAGVDPNDSLAQARADLQTAQANLAAADRTGDPGGYYAAKKAVAKAKADVAAKERALAASANDLDAARDGGALARARADLENARAGLEGLRKGTQEWNEQMAKVVAAQQAVTAAAADLKYLRMRAGSDLTDELAQAHIATLEAAEKLRKDRAAGKGPETLLPDQIDLKQKQAAEERTAFDRRLKDAQTNEQLGRISHQAYIKYLQGEHDRLASIKHKSRQQIDELNEIDLALKAATEQMQGQFNLGDINVPTPYEARTAMSGKLSSIGAHGTPTATTGVTRHHTVNIQVDGADTGQILTVLQRVLGPLATARTSPTHTRKVA